MDESQKEFSLPPIHDVESRRVSKTIMALGGNASSGSTKLPPIQRHQSLQLRASHIRKSDTHHYAHTAARPETTSSEAEDVEERLGGKRESIWVPRSSLVKKHMNQNAKPNTLSSLLAQGSSVNQVLRLLSKYDKSHAEQHSHIKKRHLQHLAHAAGKSAKKQAHQNLESFDEYLKRKSKENGFVREVELGILALAPPIAEEPEAEDADKQCTAAQTRWRLLSTAVKSNVFQAVTGTTSVQTAESIDPGTAHVTYQRTNKRENKPVTKTQAELMTQIRARARWHWAAQRILSLIKTTNMFKTNDKEEDNKKEKLKQLEEEVEAFESHGITASAIGFNMLQYKLSEKKSVLSLTNQMLQALSKETWARSKSDLGALEKLVNSLSVFAKYDPGVRKALSRVIRFSHFGPRRVIIKQGHPGQCFYIVAAGILEVKQSQILLPRVEDNNTQQNDASIIAHLHSGDSFGEVALLNDMKRNATVVSKTNTDLLWINREDFMVVLKEEAIRDIEEKQTFIASIPYFGQLPASSISQLASTAKFREVPPNTKIFSEGDCPGNVFIMCEGTSRLVKCVQFAEVDTYSHGNTHSLTPYPLRPDAHVEYGYKVVTRLLKIGDGGPGDFFGEEAAIANTGTPHQIIHLGSQGVNVDKFSKFQFSLISNTTVRYVLLNRHTFAREIILQPQLLNQAAMRVKALESGLINIPLIQEMYLNQIAWTKYKKTVSHQVKHQHLLKKSQIPTLPHLNTKIA